MQSELTNTHSQALSSSWKSNFFFLMFWVQLLKRENKLKYEKQQRMQKTLKFFLGYLHISETKNSPSKLAQRAWFHLKQMRLRIQFSSWWSSENRPVQNMHSDSSTSPETGWVSSVSGNSTVMSSLSYSLFSNWLPRVDKESVCHEKCLFLLVECLPARSSLPVTVSFSRRLFVSSAEQLPSPFVTTQCFSCRESCLWSERVGTWSWCFLFLKPEKAMGWYRVLW